jgi:hypothetical protein
MGGHDLNPPSNPFELHVQGAAPHANAAAPFRGRAAPLRGRRRPRPGLSPVVPASPDEPQGSRPT